jgi:hypothetical protein
MPILTGSDPARVLFETQLVEEDTGDPSDPYRKQRRTGNRITCNEPVAYDLLAAYRATNREPAFEIVCQLDQYEFWLLRLSCTLHPDALSYISSFDVNVSFVYPSALPPAALMLNPAGLTLLSQADPSVPFEYPIAYTLYPELIVDEVEVEHTREISPELEFGEVVSVKLSGKEAVTTKYKKMYPRIRAYGKRRGECYWRFTPGNGNKVEEGDKDLDLIVRKRRGALVRAEVAIEGQGWQFGVFPKDIPADKRQVYF